MTASFQTSGVGIAEPAIAPLSALLVEDNAADAELIATRLERSSPADVPIDLTRRTTVAAACSELRERNFDIVILDLTLPDARGLEALYMVRGCSPQTPVIVLTGLSDQNLALQALRAGAQDYVLKPPPEGATLARILRYASERQRLSQAIEAARVSSALAAKQWKLLAEISKTLATVEDPALGVPAVAKLIVPDVADCFVVFLEGDETDPQRGDLWHREGDCSDQLSAAVDEIVGGASADGDDFLRRAHSNEEAAIAEWGDTLAPVYRALGFASGTAVPLCIDRKVRGILVIAFTPGRRDAIADVEFTRSVADRISVAFDHSLLLQRAKQAVTARDRALGIVSHDLRSPLSTIQICATALLDPEPAPRSGVQHMGELIQRSASWMGHIVDDLLDRASLDSGSLALHRRPTEVAQIFDSARSIFGTIAKDRAIELRMDGAVDLPRVDADPDRLLQVLSNLISNSMKFTPSGGKIEVVAGTTDNGGASGTAWEGDREVVRFAVKDSGTGISADDVSHIFDWYWRSPTGSVSGSGLGLAIAKGLIEAHDSKLNVDTALGEGSTFWFTMPVAPDAK
jgi:signal transduction histidine kinase/DNA-binding NarL/FixJ family response regulator